MTTACSSACPTLPGRVMVTSIAATVAVDTIPAVGPAAQAIPARNDHRASRRRKVTTFPAAT